MIITLNGSVPLKRRLEQIDLISRALYDNKTAIDTVSRLLAAINIAKAVDTGHILVLLSAMERLFFGRKLVYGLSNGILSALEPLDLPKGAQLLIEPIQDMVSVSLRSDVSSPVELARLGYDSLLDAFACLLSEKWMRIPASQVFATGRASVVAVFGEGIYLPFGRYALTQLDDGDFYEETLEMMEAVLRTQPEYKHRLTLAFETILKRQIDLYSHGGIVTLNTKEGSFFKDRPLKILQLMGAPVNTIANSSEASWAKFSEGFIHDLTLRMHDFLDHIDEVQPQTAPRTRT